MGRLATIIYPAIQLEYPPLHQQMIFVGKRFGFHSKLLGKKIVHEVQKELNANGRTAYATHVKIHAGLNYHSRFLYTIFNQIVSSIFPIPPYFLKIPMFFNPLFYNPPFYHIPTFLSCCCILDSCAAREPLSSTCLALISASVTPTMGASIGWW
jgi:hypothetical protein